jgi:hypothetical protein
MLALAVMAAGDLLEKELDGVGAGLGGVPAAPDPPRLACLSAAAGLQRGHGVSGMLAEQ